MFKVKKGPMPGLYNGLFSYNNTNYNLRAKEFVIPIVNTTGFGKHSLRYLGPKVREQHSVDTFVLRS